MSWEEIYKRSKEIHNEIASELVNFGGKLKCEECGREIILTERDIKYYLLSGWPICCGYTMRWFTKNELKSE
jgi:hypothetical protein